MQSFDYMSSAELFPTRKRRRSAERQPAAESRRFDTAAEAIRYAMEELEPALLEGAYLEVSEHVFDGVGIRNLYARDAYPLPKPVPHLPSSGEGQISQSWTNVTMRADDIHVSQDRSDTWLVVEHGTRSEVARYRVRAHAMAFARAVAFGRRVEMVVHENDGSIVRHARTSLTYPTSLV